MSKMRRKVFFTASKPEERLYLFLASPAGVILALLFWYIAKRPELIWDAALLIGTTLLIAWMGFCAVEMYPHRRKKTTASYDLIWILFGTLALLTQSWKQIDSFTTSQLSSEIRLREIQAETLQKKASYALKEMKPNADKYLGDKLLIPELTAFSENNLVYLSANASYFSKSNKKPNYLSDAGLAAHESMSRLIGDRDRTNKKIDDLHIQLKEKGTPFGIQLFGSFLISMGLGLRLAKAISDIKEAFLA